MSSYQLNSGRVLLSPRPTIPDGSLSPRYFPAFINPTATSPTLNLPSTSFRPYSPIKANHNQYASTSPPISPNPWKTVHPRTRTRNRVRASSTPPRIVDSSSSSAQHATNNAKKLSEARSASPTLRSSKPGSPNLASPRGSPRAAAASRSPRAGPGSPRHLLKHNSLKLSGSGESPRLLAENPGYSSESDESASPRLPTKLAKLPAISSASPPSPVFNQSSARSPVLTPKEGPVAPTLATNTGSAAPTSMVSPFRTCIH